jgi:hypothetical protein
MLIRFGPQQEVQRTPGQTNQQGEFLFQDLQTGTAYTYFIGMRYEGQLHRSDPIVLQSGQHATGLVLELDERSAQAAGGTAGGTTAQPTLRINNHLMVIGLRDDRFEVREVVEILNAGSTPYTGQATRPGVSAFSLHLPLPQGYYNLSNVQGLAAEHMRSHATGLYYTAPLAPGEHRVTYTYSLLVRDVVTMLVIQRALDTAVLDVLVADDHLVSHSDLRSGGQVTFEPHVFQHWRGTALPAQSRSWIQLTRRTPTPRALQLGAYGLVVGIALLGLALPLYGVWRGRDSQGGTRPVTPEQVQAWRAEEQRLLRHIASLDDQREAGAIAAAEYQQRRKAYKDRLLTLAPQLQPVALGQDESQQQKERV